MAVDPKHQFKFERTLRNICRVLARNDFTLEIRFSGDEDDQRLIFIADRKGDNYVFTHWHELRQFSRVCGDLALVPRRDLTIESVRGTDG